MNDRYLSGAYAYASGPVKEICALDNGNLLIQFCPQMPHNTGSVSMNLYQVVNDYER
jgi:hypothetical protein